MIRRQTRRSRVAVGQGVLGLALGLPLALTAVTPLPAQAQDAAASERQAEAPRVLITEVVIEGLDGHPDLDRLQVEAYDAMQVRPGSRVTRAELQRDLNAIQATGWFADVRINPVNGPLGVQLIVQLVPFPQLTAVDLNPASDLLPQAVVESAFQPDYGRTLNLNDLAQRMKTLQDWLAGEGYSLARVSGPERISPDGVVTLKLTQGRVAGVKVQFLNKEGETENEKGEPIKGKTREWVVTREISIQPGDPFNRNKLERDIKRLYGTQLFSDVKVTLQPVPEQPGDVLIVLGIVEQSTGQLSGGLGYSQSQGVFGQAQIQDSNMLGRAWNVGLNVTYGQYGGLANISFSDPWIKGDEHRTSFRTSLFLSQQVPQAFQSEENGNIRTVEDAEDNGTRYSYNINSNKNPAQDTFGSVNKALKAFPSLSWLDYEGDTVVLRKTGGSFSFSRPLNGGDPFKESPWRVLAGMSLTDVRPINFAAETRPYGVSTNNFKDGKVKNKDIICISFNCADNNLLTGLRLATTYSNLNDSRNPTSGNVFTLSTEQFVGLNEDSPTFNRLRASYTQFFPVNWLKLHKGCRPDQGEKADCPQAIGVQVKGGTVVGDLPPYEAFCVGGSNSIRGWYNCDLAVARSFGEVTLEYRFPIISVLSGELFVDAGTDFHTQKDVPGKPGLLLDKDGSGVSVGTGVIVSTPVGPLRLEIATKDFTSDYRFNLGVGYKF